MEAARLWGIAENGDAAEVTVAAHLVDELHRHWPRLGLERRTDDPGPDHPLRARLALADDRTFVPGEGPELGDRPSDAAWERMEQTLTLFAVQRLIHLVAVHSAVIAWKGSLLLVPAASGAGKSTLTVAAAEAGATVLSDEYALIDPGSGLVTGWTRPVRLRSSDGTQPKHRVDLAVESDPLPVRLVAAVAYDSDAVDGAANDGGANGGGRFEPMSRAQIVMEMLANTICAQTRPDESLDAAMAVARSAVGVTGTRGEAAVAVADLLRLMDEGDPGYPSSDTA